MWQYFFFQNKGSTFFAFFSGVQLFFFLNEAPDFQKKWECQNVTAKTPKDFNFYIQPQHINIVALIVFIFP